MLQRLPESADFIQQAELGQCLKGRWPIAEFTRLQDVISDNSGELVAELEFGRRSGFYTLEGSVEANIGLICQRCLEPLKHQVSSRFRLGLVSSEEEMEKLPPELEPYLVLGDEQSIIELLEDELLLSLPIAATHAEQCSEFLGNMERQRQMEKEESSPFAVLKKLKLDQ